ncbi:hypothetical protein, partial [Mycobacterium tuberculosis]
DNLWRRNHKRHLTPPNTHDRSVMPTRGTSPAKIGGLQNNSGPGKGFGISQNISHIYAVGASADGSWQHPWAGAERSLVSGWDLHCGAPWCGIVVMKIMFISPLWCLRL